MTDSLLRSSPTAGVERLRAVAARPQDTGSSAQISVHWGPNTTSTTTTNVVSAASPSRALNANSPNRIEGVPRGAEQNGRTTEDEPHRRGEQEADVVGRGQLFAERVRAAEAVQRDAANKCGYESVAPDPDTEPVGQDGCDDNEHPL